MLVSERGNLQSNKLPTANSPLGDDFYRRRRSSRLRDLAEADCINWLCPEILSIKSMSLWKFPLSREILQTMMKKLSNHQWSAWIGQVINLSSSSCKIVYLPQENSSCFNSTIPLTLSISKFNHNHMLHLPFTMPSPAYAYHGLFLHPCAHDHPDHCGHHVHHDRCGDLDLLVVAESM